MPKQLILDQVTLCGDGSIGIRWLKQIIDPDNGELLLSEPHRTTVDLDGSAKEQINVVAQSLAKIGYQMDQTAHAALVGKIDAVGRADPQITTIRNARIAQRVAEEDERVKKE